jgi:arylsulfatase A-like enzyme
VQCERSRSAPSSACVALALVCTSCALLDADVRSPPHVVLFVVDDLGWQDLSVALGPEPTEFNRRFHTPNVERLAREGVRFTQAYAAAPVCTPTRSAIHTGRAPARSHITYWTLHADRDSSAAFPGLAPPAWDRDGLQPGDATLAHELSSRGYRALHVGKWHLGAVGTPGEDPLQLGFDVAVAGHGAGSPGSYYGTQHFSSAPGSGGNVWDVPGLERWHGKDVYLEEALAAEAVAAIDGALARGERFFLHFATYAVHAPLQPNARYLARYADLDPREATYATMVESADAALGVVLDQLAARGVADETLLIFTSDNGGLSAHGRGGVAHTHNAPLRSGKGSAYEGGLRVPLIVRWPGVARPGALCAAPVVSTDLFPTVCAAAGVGLASASAACDGRDLTPLLRGSTESAARRLVWHQPHYWGVRGPGIWPFSALREGDLKLIYRHADRDFELYDLAADLSESRDLAAAAPERVRTLARALGEELRALGAQMSLDTSTGRPVEWPDDVAPLR